MNSLSYFHCKSFPLLPRYLILLILQVGPKWTPTAILQNNTVIFCFGNSSQKHHNEGMPNSFHSIALTEKISKTYISILNFEFFNDHGNLSPFGFIYNSITSLIDSLNNFELIPLNLNIRSKLPELGNTINVKFRESLSLLTRFFWRLALLKQS